MSLAAGMYPEKTASVIGLISSGCGIGGVLYPILMGALVKFTPLVSGFLFLSISSMLACLFIWIASNSASAKP
jgi:nitrate/nitrite transporter NarK